MSETKAEARQAAGLPVDLQQLVIERSHDLVTLIEPDSFPNKVMVRFLGGIVSRPGPDNSGAMTAIFGQSGYYEFRVGNDLGTNRPRDVQECTIKLVPRSRY